MIPAQPRPFTIPLWPVYRDGLLVAAFRTLEAAAAFEDLLEDEAEIADTAATEPEPIADAVRALLDVSDLPHKADGRTVRPSTGGSK